MWILGWFVIYRNPEPLDTGSSNAAASAPGVARQRQRVTWSSLFRHRTLWGMMLGFFCLNFVIYFFITWFSSYLVQTRGFSLKSLGTLGMIPALISIPGGWLGGMLLSSVITLSAFTANVYLMLAFFGIAYGSLAFAAASIWSLPGDVAPTPDHVASIGGIQNFASNLAGIVITTFTGVMVAMTKGSFTIPLVVAGPAASAFSARSAIW
ncbi:MAG: D-galactonate transporter [uncultured Paraburkholderia sp.]|nr:MAG: D-galactonate transporter [uncultured Paraburkholderia sp.]CAH2807024.1 MAG: D-galactonate transporter [uncultured Paraburkholderia sp.]CAH2942546.1 MAG: D-galactonate transporter [uncultured Paraburkholderia sp.]